MPAAAPGPEAAPPRPAAGDRPPAGPGRLARLRLPLALALLTALVYVNAAPKVLLYDDRAIISQGVGLDRLDQIPGLFRQHARAASNEPSRLYRPLLTTSLVVDRVLYRNNARGFHLTSIALHVVVTLLLFGLLGAFGLSRVAAFGAALAFGVHPIHTEAVDLAFNRSELLAALGVLGGLAWIWRFFPRRRALALGGGAVIYFLALLCRESAVTLPVLAALMLALLRPAGGVRAELRRLAPLALLVVPLGAYLLLRQGALGEPGGGIAQSFSQGLAGPGGTSGRLALVAATLRDYLRMLVFPQPLRLTCEDYVVRFVWLALLVHAVVLGTAAQCRRRAPLVAFGLGFIYVALLPSTKLFADPATLAERFVYLPSAGAAMALAWLLAALARRAGARAALLATIALAGALAPLTLLRNLDFHSKRSLWESELRATQDDWQVILNLSEAYLPEGRNDAVLALCTRGRELFPGHPGFHSNAAVAYFNLSRYAEAEAEFRAAVQVGGRAFDHANLARHLVFQRRFAEAEAHYEQAIARADDESMRHALRAELLTHCRHDQAGARAEFEAALALQPRLNLARTGLRRLPRDPSPAGRPPPAAGPASAPAAPASQAGAPRP